MTAPDPAPYFPPESTGRQWDTVFVAYATVGLLPSEASYANAHPLVLDGGATGIA